MNVRRFFRRSLADADLTQELAQQSACGTNERMSRFVLLVAGLLADQHQPRAARPLADDCLGRGAPKGTTTTVCGALVPAVQVGGDVVNVKVLHDPKAPDAASDANAVPADRPAAGLVLRSETAVPGARELRETARGRRFFQASL